MSNRLDNAGQSESRKAFFYVTAKSSRTAFFSQLHKSDKLRLKVRDLLWIYIFIPRFKYIKNSSFERILVHDKGCYKIAEIQNNSFIATSTRDHKNTRKRLLILQNF